MRRTAFLALAAGLAVAWATASPASAAPLGPEVARRGAEYIAARQQPNGAFFSATNAADGVAEAIEALVAGDMTGDPIRRALSYMRDQGPARAATGAGRAGRIVLGLVAAGEDPRAFGGFDYLARLKAYYDPVTGIYDSTNLYANALAALGVIAAGEDLPDQAVAYMRANQCTNGGFASATGCGGTGAGADTTALILTILVGRDDAASSLARSRATDFLRSAQNTDGGFGDRSGGVTNANSTGLALSGIVALGEDPASWLNSGHDPTQALAALQVSSGGFKYRASDTDANDYATVQAVPGIAARAYPIRPRAHAPTPSPSGSSPRATADPPDGTPTPTESDRGISESSEPSDGTSTPSPVASVLGARYESSPASTRSARGPVALVLAAAALSATALAGALAARRRRRTR